jgi:hypothetical protein
VIAEGESEGMTPLPFIYMNETRKCFSRAETQRLSHPLELFVPRTHFEFVFEEWRRTFGRLGLYDLRHIGVCAPARAATGPGRRLRGMKPMRLSIAA